MQLSACFVLASVLGALGCTHASPPPLTVRARDMGNGPPLQAGQPLVIEFDEGDVIPLVVSVDGDLASTPPELAPIPIRVKRHFFLKMEGSSIRASTDGKSYENRAPGSFRLGLSASRETGARVEMRIVTPSH
jgi:hypothetical protein